MCGSPDPIGVADPHTAGWAGPDAPPDAVVVGVAVEQTPATNTTEHVPRAPDRRLAPPKGPPVAKSKFERTKPHLNIGTIGGGKAVGAGRSGLLTSEATPEDSADRLTDLEIVAAGGFGTPTQHILGEWA